MNPNQRVPGPQLPGLVSGVTLLLGVWLVLAPFALEYDIDTIVDARWHHALVGSALAVVGYVRLTRPVRLIPVTVAGLVLGVWLTIAPFALAFDVVSDDMRVVLSEVIVGVVITSLTFVGYIDARDPAHAAEHAREAR